MSVLISNNLMGQTTRRELRPFSSVKKEPNDLSIERILQNKNQIGKTSSTRKLDSVIRRMDSHLSKKKIGLVLGGGGAKAAAEVGVLKVLDSLDIHVDYIAGSSMGAVIGSLYASGYKAKEIETMLLTEEWLSLFDKEELGFYATSDRTLFGLIKGETFENRLRNALNKKMVVYFGDTNIPFRCTATRIVDNDLDEIVFGDKTMDLAIAVRASITFPGAYSPVIYNGMKLVDGGTLNNLPVDLIKDEVDVIIAIDLEQVRHNDRKRNILSGVSLGRLVSSYFGADLRLGWIIDWIKDHKDYNKHNDNMRYARSEGNTYINPSLEGYDITSFGKRELQQMIEIGSMEAERNINIY